MTDVRNTQLSDQADRRAKHLLMLEFGDRDDFDDPKLEYRRLFSELFGTFLLVLAAAGGGILVGEAEISLAAAVVAPGLMVMAIILFMGAVSGAHLNPGVSLAFALRGDFPWKRVPGYIIVQLVGATLACLFLYAVFGNIQHLGATEPGAGYEDWQALLMEIALTTALVSVILGTASAAQNVGAVAALGVGGYIALAGLWAAPVSGVSMNPARSFGPGARQRRLDELLGLRRRPARRRLHRGAVRRDPARARRRPDRARRRLGGPDPGQARGEGEALGGDRPRRRRAARPDRRHARGGRGRAGPGRGGAQPGVDRRAAGRRGRGRRAAAPAKKAKKSKKSRR